MVEKFSIVKRNIDFKKLMLKIDEFILINNLQPYIFMNQETIDNLIEIVGYSSDGLMGSEDKVMCGRFNGNKVFCDNILDFGEIELK